MISVIEETNPTIFSIWQHNMCLPYYDGTCLATRGVKLWALQDAKEYMLIELAEIQTKIQQIHENTKIKECSKS